VPNPSFPILTVLPAKPSWSRTSTLADCPRSCTASQREGADDFAVGATSRVKAYALTGTQRRVWRFLHADLDAFVTQKKPVVSSAQPSVLANERRL